MTMKTVVLAVAATACVSAAAAGGYAALHSRGTVDVTPPVDAQAVATTEQLVSPAPTPAPETSLPVAAPASSHTAVAPAGAPRPDRARPAVESSRPAAPDSVPSTPPVSASSAPSATTSAATTAVADPTPQVSTSSNAAMSAPAEPPRPRMEEVTVKEDAVIGITLESAVSTETSKVEDRVTALVTRDVTVEGRTAIPAKARLEGVVTMVERGGKFNNRARLGIRFETLVLADNTRVPLHTDTIFREGDSPAGPATSKIGAGVVGGAILGAMIGGKKGAAIGSTIGAAGGTATVMAGSPSIAQISSGTPLTVRLTQPVTLLIERNPY